MADLAGGHTCPNAESPIQSKTATDKRNALRDDSTERTGGKDRIAERFQSDSTSEFNGQSSEVERQLKAPADQPPEEFPADQSPRDDYSFEIELQDNSDHESMFSRKSVSSASSAKKSASFVESTGSLQSSCSSRTSSSDSESSAGELNNRQSSMQTDNESQKSGSFRSVDRESGRSISKNLRQSGVLGRSRRSPSESKRKIKETRKRSVSRGSHESRRPTSDNFRKRAKISDRSHKSRRSRSVSARRGRGDSTQWSRRRGGRQRSRSRTGEPSHHQSINSNETKTFTDFNFSSNTLRRLRQMKVHEPNEMQKLVLPALMDSHFERNILVQSKPLSGKKLMALICALERINENLEQPQVFIMAPTPEKCGQIVDMARTLRDGTRVRVAYLQRDFDMRNTKMVDQVVVGTLPTMLACLRKFDVLSPKFVRLMVYDDIDSLTTCQRDLRSITTIEEYLRSDCQRLYLSVSFGSNISKLVRECFNSNLITFNDCLRDDLTRNVLQFYTTFSRKIDQYKALLRVLHNVKFKQVILYAPNSECAHELAAGLYENGYNAVAITSATPCEERLKFIARFKKHGEGVLVLTYPMTNGAELGAHLSLVINYGLRLNQGNFIEYYHRIGKVGRQQRPGFVLNIVDRKDMGTIEKLEDDLAIQMIELFC